MSNNKFDGFAVSNYENGPWSDGFESRDDAKENAAFELLDEEDQPWHIRHPDGRIEKVDYYGDHLEWVVTP